mgnify:CR=1 FL=1
MGLYFPRIRTHCRILQIHDACAATRLSDGAVVVVDVVEGVRVQTRFALRAACAERLACDFKYRSTLLACHFRFDSSFLAAGNTQAPKTTHVYYNSWSLVCSMP